MNAASASPAGAPSAVAATVRGAGSADASSVTAGMARSSAVLSVATGLVGVLSYACTVVMAHLLTTGDYIDYSAAQALLTSVGVAASALIPLPLSQVVRAHPAGSPQRRRGMAFAVWVSLLTGITAGVALTGVTVLFTGLGVAVVVGAAGLFLFVIMPTWGWLQGELRFGRYAGVSIAEVGLRLGFSVVAALCGWGAAGALGGFIVGAAVVALMGLVWARRDLAWSPAVVADRGRWAETGGIALVQLVLSGLVNADVVLVALLGNPASPAVAGYQAMATLAKGPVYVAAATMLISFPLLRTAPPKRVAAILNQALRSFSALALPAAAVLATLPAGLALLVLPARYSGSLSVLPWLALAGLGYGAVTVLAVALLALRAYRRSLLGLFVAVVALGAGLLGGWFADRTDGTAIGGALGAVAAATFLALLARPLLPTALAGPLGRLLAGSVLFAAVLFAVRPLPALWAAAVVVGGVVVLRAAGHQPGGHTPAIGSTPPQRLSVLHLGFEDPAAPGAGGGSLRTHEINRRLVAAGHRVTVLTTRFPGCIDRVSDGVRYVHIGFGAGRTRLTRLFGYLLGLPCAVRGSAADLVVEDFFAPISTIAAPLWTGRPTIGVVQWLNAREKARQYKLPVHLVERFGVRHHRRLIAVSEGIADRLRVMNPRAAVEVIGNGVDPAAFGTTPQLGDDVVFIGRLETAQKGLDLLLTAWAAASLQIACQLVIAGTGPDERRLRDQAAELGITDRVRFIGWVSGAAKYQLLAAARLAVMPSRFETFGVVAIEALATGTPVVAFDIPCLREVIPTGCGLRIAPFDVTAYAQAITELYHNPAAVTAAAPHARAFAAGYDWDIVADRQQCAYTAALTDAITRPSRPRLSTRPILLAQLDPLEKQLTAVGRGRAGGRPRRIVALGNVGNGNTGDEALMTVTLHRLGADAEVTLLSRHPDRATEMHGVPAQSLSLTEALGSLWRCDGVIVVGGGMFGPGLPPLVRWLPRLAAIGHTLGRDIAYVGIGVYPGLPGRPLAILRRAARRGQVTVRDELSARTLGTNDPMINIGDLARELAPAPASDARAALRDAGVDTDRPILLLAPKAAPTTYQTEQLLAWCSTAVTQWTTHGGTVLAVAFSSRTDYGIPSDATDAALAKQIAYRSATPVPILGPDLPPALVSSVVADASAVLGLRFHALIFATAAGVPCIAPPWEPKTRALLDERRLPHLNDTADLHAWLESSMPLHPTPIRSR